MDLYYAGLLISRGIYQQIKLKSEPLLSKLKLSMIP
jgi:hypothetical protein